MKQLMLLVHFLWRHRDEGLNCKKKVTETKKKKTSWKTSSTVKLIKNCSINFNVYNKSTFFTISQHFKPNRQFPMCLSSVFRIPKKLQKFIMREKCSTLSRFQGVSRVLCWSFYNLFYHFFFLTLECFNNPSKLIQTF